MGMNKLSAAELSLRLAQQEYEHDGKLIVHAKTALEAAESFKDMVRALKQENNVLRRSIQTIKECDKWN